MVYYLTQEERYDEILDVVSKVVAHPHENTTLHDKHRAIVLISFLSGDNDMVEYFYSQMNEEDFKLTKQIRASVAKKEVVN